MESSRIFVKNLPPNLAEPELRQHFSSGGRGGRITDIKLIPKRRIAFLGYKSAQHAADAVEYFDRTYIRMSRITVQWARAVSNPRNQEPLRSYAAKEKPSIPRAEEEKDIDSGKRRDSAPDTTDPKLQEYLELYSHKRLRDQEQNDQKLSQSDPVVHILGAEESGDEYEEISSRPSKPLRRDQEDRAGMDINDPGETGNNTSGGINPSGPSMVREAVKEVHKVSPGATDDAWLRMRTNRLLDLVDLDEPGFANPARVTSYGLGGAEIGEPPRQEASRVVVGPDMMEVSQLAGGELEDGTTKFPPTTPFVRKYGSEIGTGAAETSRDHGPASANASQEQEPTVDLIMKTSRLFIRNLAYTATEEEVIAHFGTFGPLREVHLPVTDQGSNKGFAFVTYDEPPAAIAALQNADGSTFQGRIIHVLPADSAKKRGHEDDFAVSQMPLKKQRLIKKKSSSSAFNWNALFMSQDAINASLADRLGVSKSDLLDPTDTSAAITQALAETQVIQEAKAYFAANGVDLDAFKRQKRGDTSILAKNFKFGTSAQDLRTMFEECGVVLRVLMPPSGTIAIIQFAQSGQAKAALSKLAYRRIGDSVLFLEAGPQGLFKDSVVASLKDEQPTDVQQKPSMSQILESADETGQLETSSLFVRGLSFSTTTSRLADTFRVLDGFVSALVKTKSDPKKPGQVLSMGFGFVEFRTKEQASTAMKTIDGYTLDGHTLSCRASHRGREEELGRKKATAGQRTKVVIKNLPFEATKKDIRQLFGTYGQLRVVRVPKKFDNSSRGFAFADFVTPKEAASAMHALKDTHLLGRRLVLEYADEADGVDAEEEIARMQKKAGDQVGKVALQRLIGGGRKKFSVGDDDEEG